MNDFIEYYKTHNIVPSEQKEDYEVHFEKRRKLYRQLGIPLIAFRNADILDVGSGDGYNTAAFFEFGAAYIDMVEPVWGGGIKG